MAQQKVLVSLRGLRRSFREGEQTRTVIEDLDLELRDGECAALFGRSGSGKSTLLNLMSGIDSPDAGEVQIAGQALTALDERARTLFRRRHIGFVYQFFNLIPTLTVEENLLLPLELNGCSESAAQQAARALLRDVGLADRHGSFPDRLSGGEQQRIAMARALIHDPLLVLADEPTGNLDAETGRQILSLLERLTRGRGKTLLVVTHSEEVAALADRVLELRNGRVAPRAQSSSP